MWETVIRLMLRVNRIETVTLLLGSFSRALSHYFLTVASYNLQHPAQFTDEAINGLRATFIEQSGADQRS
jgi:hypothetical protein